MISAIMPTYNRGHTCLIQTIKDIQAQTYKNWELIIVDDGSTDGTNDIVTKHTIETQDKRIHYQRAFVNSGCVTIPRNIGIVVSEGEFIAHCDDDIVHFPHKFEVLVEALNNRPDLDLAYGLRRAERQGPGGIGTDIYDIVGPRNYNPLETWGVDGSQFMYRRRVYNDIPLVFCKRGCDWETMKAIYRNNPEFIEVDSIVSQYNWHGGNRSLDDEGTKNRMYYPERYRSTFEYYNSDSKYKYSLEPF